MYNFIIISRRKIQRIQELQRDKKMKKRKIYLKSSLSVRVCVQEDPCLNIKHGMCLYVLKVKLNANEMRCCLFFHVHETFLVNERKIRRGTRHSLDLHYIIFFLSFFVQDTQDKKKIHTHKDVIE